MHIIAKVASGSSPVGTTLLGWVAVRIIGWMGLLSAVSHSLGLSLEEFLILSIQIFIGVLRLGCGIANGKSLIMLSLLLLEVRVGSSAARLHLRMLLV